jgi:hypothetical protein
LNAEGVAYPSRCFHLCVKTALAGRQDPYCLCYPKQAISEPRRKIQKSRMESRLSRQTPRPILKCD